VEPLLRDVATALEEGKVTGARPFDPRGCAAPLPRAYQWADASAYVNHVELVRKARGAQMPDSFWEDPLIYQGGSDELLGARDPARFVSEEHGIDLEAEVGVITDDVPMATGAEQMEGHIKLIVLINDWTLRHLVPSELAKGFGFYQSKPATGFSPVAVTPDELGAAWHDGKVHLRLISHINGTLLGRPDAGVDMTFDFHRLLAHAARTRRLGAGTILGSGTISNLDRSAGSSCLAERRTLEQIEHGAPKTPFLRYGDTVRIEMVDETGRSIFGAIEQTVSRP
jgi:fumarylacetoacetate (FAA) hydrolase